jgi:lipoprotein-anchoring transpeptidase ErfK/SrfK
MHRTFTIPVLLVLLLAGCATSPSSRPDAEALLHDLRMGELQATHYEEYLSFMRIIEAAELKQRNGSYDEAEELYRLAVVKGLILKQARHEPQVLPAAASAGNDSSLTQKEVLPPPASAGEPAGKVSAPAPPNEKMSGLLSERIVGGEGVYLVKEKETLRLVGSRLGAGWRQLARLNRINPDKPLQPGQKIKYNNRKIVPKKIRDGILVNIPERKLYLFKNDQLRATYPVAAGIAKKNEKTIWRTPTGKFTIVDKRENPSWLVPLSIRKEMEEAGEEVLDLVPPGPKNPLGKFALKTSLSGIMIHSTIRPASIYTFSSHGCIRVMPEHMEALFRDVSVNMPGEIIYQPVKIEVTTDKRVFLEVNRDVYEQVKDIKVEVKRLVTKKGVGDSVSWEKIDKVIRESAGIAEDVTLKHGGVAAWSE